MGSLQWLGEQHRDTLRLLRSSEICGAGRLSLPIRVSLFLFLFALAEPDDSPQGSALCKFELYDPSITRTRRSTIQKLEAQGLPRRQIVLRILKIEDPVSCVIPDYDEWVQEPKAGDLLRIGRHGVPWSYDVDTREMRPVIAERLGLTQERMREDMDGLKLLLDDH